MEKDLGESFGVFLLLKKMPKCLLVLMIIVC